MKLKLYEKARSHVGTTMGTGPVSVVQYVVHGMPPGEEALIAYYGDPNRGSWRVLRVKGGEQGQWEGDYASADDALAMLQRELEG